MPIKVLALDQVDFPKPVPPLELFLTRDRTLHVAEEFIADEGVDDVPSCEAAGKTLPMLEDARYQVARHADVQGATRLAGEDVDAGLALPNHQLLRVAEWMLKQVQHDGHDVNLSTKRHSALVSGNIVKSHFSTL